MKAFYAKAVVLINTSEVESNVPEMSMVLTLLRGWRLNVLLKLRTHFGSVEVKVSDFRERFGS